MTDERNKKRSSGAFNFGNAHSSTRYSFGAGGASNSAPPNGLFGAPPAPAPATGGGLFGSGLSSGNRSVDRDGFHDTRSFNNHTGSARSDAFDYSGFGTHENENQNPEQPSTESTINILVHKMIESQDPSEKQMYATLLNQMLENQKEAARVRVAQEKRQAIEAVKKIFIEEEPSLRNTST